MSHAIATPLPSILSAEQHALLSRFADGADNAALLWASGYLAGAARIASPALPHAAAQVEAAQPATVLYGSQTGNAKRAAEALHAKLQGAGLPVRLDLRRSSDRAIFLYGRCDPRGVAAIERVMAALDCRTAWDVGANRGNHSAFMRRHCRRLFAFEPDPAEFPRLTALLGGELRWTSTRVQGYRLARQLLLIRAASRSGACRPRLRRASDRPARPGR